MDVFRLLFQFVASFSFSDRSTLFSSCRNNPYIWGDNFAHLPQILLVLVDILDTELSNAAMNPRIRAIITQMNSSNAALLTSAAAQLEAEHQSILTEILAGR